MLVVGDPTSSNSNRLCEVAKKRGIPSYLINDEGEIDNAWLRNVRVIGLTAGASTPEEIVQCCIQTLYSLGVTKTKNLVYTEEDVSFELPRAVL